MPFYGRVVFLWVQPNCADLQTECPAGSDHRKRRETGLMHALHTKQFTRKEKYQNTVNEIIDAFNSMTKSFNSSMRRCNIHELIFWSCLTAHWGAEEPHVRAQISGMCRGVFLLMHFIDFSNQKDYIEISTLFLNRLHVHLLWSARVLALLHFYNSLFRTSILCFKLKHATARIHRPVVYRLLFKLVMLGKL